MVALFCLFFNSAQPMLAADRTLIPAKPCGPAASLAAAKKSIYLTTTLQNKAGESITIDMARAYTEDNYYLPTEAERDKPGYFSFLNEYEQKFGHPKKPCPPPRAQAPPTVSEMGYSSEMPKTLVVGQQLVLHPSVWMSDGTRTKDFTAASSNPSILRVVKNSDGSVAITALKPGKANVVLTPTKDPSKELTITNFTVKSSPDAGISPWWLLLLLLPLGLFIWAYRERNRFRNQSVQAQLAQQATAQDVTRLQGEIAALQAQWNDEAALEARLQELRNPPPAGPVVVEGPRPVA